MSEWASTGINFITLLVVSAAIGISVADLLNRLIKHIIEWWKKRK